MRTETITDAHAEYLVDVVPGHKLPAVFEFKPTGDIESVVTKLPVDPLVKDEPTELWQLQEARPADPYSIDTLDIDLQLLASDARDQHADKFRHIIRMGASFDFSRTNRSPRDFEAYAVATMGLDASLYYHGAEQARRMASLFEVQQKALGYVFEDLLITHGNTVGTLDAFNQAKAELGDVSYSTYKYGVSCGLLHDYGEARMGVDIPIEYKNNPDYDHRERAEATTMAVEIHTPIGDEELMALLTKRFMHANNNGPALNSEEQREVAGYLHPGEIVQALHGTELQTNGNVFRGSAFHAVERMEYVLSGIRAFEAIENDFNGAMSDPILRQNLLRLGVSTFYLSLAKLTEHAEKYVSVYDFIAQNQGQITKYIDMVSQDIEARWDDPDYANPPFVIDPFTNYPVISDETELITRDQSKERFLATRDHWYKWLQKPHLVRSIWEAHFGTAHEMTRTNPDVSFLHLTARRRRSLAAGIGEVLVAKNLYDMFGVGLDAEEQARHERLFEEFYIGQEV